MSESVCHARDISIVYTPLHGVGETSVARALATAGFRRVHILASQRTPDGDFPNVPDHVANPEYPRTLEAAIAEAKSARRRPGHRQRPRRRSHRRRGSRLARSPRRMDHARRQPDRRHAGGLRDEGNPKHSGGSGPTIIWSRHWSRRRWLGALAEREGVRIEDDLLVGFKWIAHRIDEAGHASFLFAFEESHGYLKGDHARDKDAAVGALLFAELAAAVKDRKQTVLEYLDDLYIDVGHHGDRPINKTYPGREGLAKIKTLMKALRERPPRQIGGLALTDVYDYKTARDPRPESLGAGPSPARAVTATCSSFTPNTRAPGSRRGRREPSPRSSFTCSREPRSPAPTHLAAAKTETETSPRPDGRDLEKYLDDAIQSCHERADQARPIASPCSQRSGSRLIQAISRRLAN